MKANNINIIHYGSDMKLLVIDGSLLSAARLMTLMESVSDCELVGCAQDVLSALAQVAAVAPDFVVLDLHLQGGSGLTVLRQIKTGQPSTFVIVLTNASNEQYRKKCFELGADHFFDKSSEFHLVAGAVRSRIRALREMSGQQAPAN